MARFKSDRQRRAVMAKLKWTTKYRKNPADGAKIEKIRRLPFGEKRYAVISADKAFDKTWYVVGHLYQAKDGILTKKISDTYHIAPNKIKAQKKVNQLRKKYDDRI